MSILLNTNHERNFSVAKPTSISEKLGVSFWLFMIWIALMVFCAVNAEVLPHPEYDALDWMSQSASQGSTDFMVDSFDSLLDTGICKTRTFYNGYSNGYNQ